MQNGVAHLAHSNGYFCFAHNCERTRCHFVNVVNSRRRQLWLVRKVKTERAMEGQVFETNRNGRRCSSCQFKFIGGADPLDS
jgi:hypothetical protein